MDRRLSVALGAGLRAGVLAAFANAAVVVALAATLPEVNHVHPEGTPDHVHPLSEVFGPVTGGVPAVPIATGDEFVRQAVALQPPTPATARAWSDCGVRDPPAGASARTLAREPVASCNRRRA